MRICIVAEHASRRFGGEAILPIHYFERLLARGDDVWLVVHARTRDELEATFPHEKHRLRLVEDAWFHRLLNRISGALPRRIAESTVSLLSILITQFLARRIVVQLRDSEGLDIVHQPIPVSPRFPSLMFGLNLPVVIGPMNGGMEYPPAFRDSESILSRIYVPLGRQLAELANSVLPGKKLATSLVVANRRTRLALSRHVRGQVFEVPENGVDLAVWTTCEKIRSDSSPPSLGIARFVFIGRLIDLKCLDVALEALQQVPDACLDVIGDGPMRKRWEALAGQLGLSSRVAFHGWLTQGDCAWRMRSAIALLLPSICECGGAVVLEAMAAGAAVIATKWGGPVDYVVDETGILIDPSSRSGLIHGFASAMQELVAAPEKAREMGRQGQQRVRSHFDWEKKVDVMIDIYKDAIISFRSTQPSREE